MLTALYLLVIRSEYIPKPKSCEHAHASFMKSWLGTKNITLNLSSHS